MHIYYNDKDAKHKIASEIIEQINADKEIIILCIGTDRSTGDCLGPLVGTKLLENGIDCPVYGCLETPIHATNLEKNIEAIKAKHPDSFVIAIDACLGASCHVGAIKVKTGSLKPGSGLNKVLPEVGDVSIIATVNHGSFIDLLQYTRLSLVYKMADEISSALVMAIDSLQIKEVVAI
jgi:putative sporulation protein YyaC